MIIQIDHYILRILHSRGLEDMNSIFVYQRKYFTNKRNDWVEYYFYYNKLEFFKLPWIFLFNQIDKKKSLV